MITQLPPRTVIVKDLVYGVAKAVLSNRADGDSRVSMIELMRSSGVDDGAYYPAESYTLMGPDSFQALREFVDAVTAALASAKMSKP